MVTCGSERVKSFYFFLSPFFNAWKYINPFSGQTQIQVQGRIWLLIPWLLSRPRFISVRYMYLLCLVTNYFVIILFYATWRKTLHSVPWLELVVRRLVSANPRLNFHVGFFIPLWRSLFGIIFSIPFFIASHNQILHKRKYTKFLVYTLRFHTNPGLTLSSFEQPSPDLQV